MKSKIPLLALLLGVVCFWAALGYFAVQIRMLNPAKPDFRIKAVAHQWWWEFDYPSLGVRTSNILYLPSSRNVRLELSSGDVIHSFWVLGMKDSVNIPPGRIKSIDLTLTSPGELYGNCESGCGCGTSCMRFRVVAQTPTQFEQWAANEHAHPSLFKPPQLASAPACATDPARDRRGAVPPNTHLQQLLDNG
jgi:heme/copper-type cytochrome/quinol oxidase subunit 2